MDPRAVLSNLRKKRGHIKGLITRQANHIQELDSRAAPSPETTKAASELLRKVRGLDDDYKKIHFDILECINEADKDALDQEQENFSTHDDQIEACCARINKVMHDPSASDEKNVKIIRLKLRKLKGRITSAQDTIAAGGSTVDSALLTSVGRELGDYCRILRELENELFAMDLPEDHELFSLHQETDDLRLVCQRRCDELSAKSSTPPSSTTTTSPGDVCKLKKLEIPKFNGDIMVWDQFWDRFKTAVHENKKLTCAEKWEYLHQALMGGPARDSLSGFSRSEGQYDDAVKWLMERYHQPREVIKQHTRAIMECQATKEGDPKELRRIYTVWSQHTRALEELGHKMDPAILTCLLELKLDKQTLAKWKWETRTHVAVVPDIVDLLTFIKDQAAALESQPQEKKRSQVTSTEKKPHSFNKPVNSFATNVNPSQPRCIICPNDRHPLCL